MQVLLFAVYFMGGLFTALIIMFLSANSAVVTKYSSNPVMFLEEEKAKLLLALALLLFPRCKKELGEISS